MKDETESDLCVLLIDTETLTEFKIREHLGYLSTKSTYFNKTGNVRINVTLRCVRLTIVAAKKQ
jgi:hypothetical protein